MQMPHHIRGVCWFTGKCVEEARNTQMPHYIEEWPGVQASMWRRAAEC